MTMTLDSHQRQFGDLPFGTYNSQPQFTAPVWTSTSGPSTSQNIYAAQHGMNSHIGMELKPSQTGRMGNAGYAGMPLQAGSPDLMSPARMQTQNPPAYGSEYANPSAAQQQQHQPYSSPSPYDSMGYVQAPIRSTYAMLPQHEDSSRLSSQSLSSVESSGGFRDAIAASHGMIAMSQNSTPRNIYGPGPGSRSSRNGSTDSYGFPTTHGTSSSISSTGSYPSYYAGSACSSVSDYSNAGSDIESVSSRTLPRPSGLLGGGLPPAPSSMMGQFSSKVSSSTQKKHKCKVCDKRFTRPSSLQTHMYSHTGEKPFSCEVEGCGRHFSVVSNLRRHRKVHKGDSRSEAGSDDHQDSD